MGRILVDYQGKEIKSNDIVKRENLETGEVTYFLYKDLPKNKAVLYGYSRKGNINKKDVMNNIYFDDGVDIVSNYLRRWVRVGTKEEVYNIIFKK